MKNHIELRNGPFRLIRTPMIDASPKEAEDGCVKFATDMALIHNCWIRAFNGLYLSAPDVPPEEYAAFLGYASCVYAAVKKHHDEEEDFVFPLIEKECGKKGLMEVNVHQHEAFETGFTAWGEYVLNLVKTGQTSSFSASVFLRHMDSFSTPLQLHLEEEIQSLLGLREYPNCDMNTLAVKAHNEVLAHMKMVELRDNLPVLLLNHDSTFEEGIHGIWPPMPGPMNFALRRIATLYNSSFWKYTTCTKGQMPKESFFPQQLSKAG